MSHFSDADYEAAGARIVDAEEIWKNSDIVIKVRGRREGREEHTSSSNVMFIDYSTTGSRRVAVWCGVVVGEGCVVVVARSLDIHYALYGEESNKAETCHAVSFPRRDRTRS